MAIFHLLTCLLDKLHYFTPFCVCVASHKTVELTVILIDDILQAPTQLSNLHLALLNNHSIIQQRKPSGEFLHDWKNILEQKIYADICGITVLEMFFKILPKNVFSNCKMQYLSVMMWLNKNILRIQTKNKNLFFKHYASISGFQNCPLDLSQTFYVYMCSTPQSDK